MNYSPYPSGTLSDLSKGGGGGHGGGGHGGGGHGGGGHGGGFHHGGVRPFFRRGSRFDGWGGWGGPWWGDVVVVSTASCSTWGDPIPMSPPMLASAQASLSASSGRPVTVRGPDGVIYLFAMENGVPTARACAALGVSSASGAPNFLGYPGVGVADVGVGSFFGNLVKIITAPVTAPIHAIAQVTKKIPVLGNITHIADEATAAPFKVAVNIASGERLDHVALDAFKDQLKIVHDVAPYAKTVVAFIPGIGTGVAAAIGAGAALAEGRSIDDAVKEAIKSAIPGGQLASAGFDMAMKVGSGESLSKAALETARDQLPAGAQQAFDIGLAVATGKRLQDVLVKSLVSLAPEGLKAVVDAGQKAINSVPGLAAALKTLPIGNAQEGFRVAAGLLSHAGINEKSLSAVRASLPADVVKGFDTALKTQEAHLPWLKNVTNPAGAAAAAADALKKLAALPPADRQKLVDMAALAKLSPAQQNQLRALATANAAKAAAAAKAPPKAAQPPKKPVPRLPEPPKRVAAGAPAKAPVAPAKPGAAPATPGAPSAAPGAPAAQAGAYAPYPKMGAVSGALASRGAMDCVKGGAFVEGALGGCGGDCDMIGAPITDMPADMRWAGRSAVQGSRGQPRKVQGPNGVVYLFSIENGVLTARRCAA